MHTYKSYVLHKHAYTTNTGISLAIYFCEGIKITLHAMHDFIDLQKIAHN